MQLLVIFILIKNIMKSVNFYQNLFSLVYNCYQFISIRSYTKIATLKIFCLTGKLNQVLKV